MDLLRKDLILFRTARPSSEVFKLKFGDWLSIKHLLQSAAKSFENNSNEAKRLQELSVCADSKAPVRFNLKEVSYLTKKVFEIIQKEFFPDLPAENEEIWNALRDRRHAEIAILQDNSRTRAFQGPNNAGVGNNPQPIEQTVMNVEPAVPPAALITTSQSRFGPSEPNRDSGGFVYQGNHREDSPSLDADVCGTALHPVVDEAMAMHADPALRTSFSPSSPLDPGECSTDPAAADSPPQTSIRRSSSQVDSSASHRTTRHTDPQCARSLPPCESQRHDLLQLLLHRHARTLMPRLSPAAAHPPPPAAPILARRRRRRRREQRRRRRRGAAAAHRAAPHGHAELRRLRRLRRGAGACGG